MRTCYEPGITEVKVRGHKMKLHDMGRNENID